jgi:hypothetical protein
MCSISRSIPSAATADELTWRRGATHRRIVMPGRNKQRSTFEKRQREISRREKQAEKRARRQGKVIEPVADEPERGEPLSAEEAFRQSLGQYPTEVDAGS